MPERPPDEPDVVLDTVCGERSDSPDVTDEDRAEFAGRLRRLRGELRERETATPDRLSDDQLNWRSVLALHQQNPDAVGPTGQNWLIRELAAEVDRLKADLEAAEQEVETRGETIDRLRAELNATTVTAEEGLEVNGELLAENVHLRKHGCPHVVTSGEGTSHCGLAVMEMAKAIAEIEQLQARREELVATVRDVADTIARWSISGSTASTLRDACDRAEGKG